MTPHTPEELHQDRLESLRDHGRPEPRLDVIGCGHRAGAGA
jgi:hypothetical protein